MQINRIGVPPTFGGKIFVPRKQNLDRTFMFNEVMDFTHTHKLPCTVTNEGVDFPSISEKLIEKFKELGLKFIDKTKSL